MSIYYNPSMTGWWRCCNQNCKREVNSELFQTTCPDCGHEKCDSCVAINKTAAASWSSSLQPHSHGHSHDHSHNRPSRGLEKQHHHHHDYQPAPSSAGISYSRRPNMSGYWLCCQCHGAVYLANSGWTCPIEGHTYCGPPGYGYCTLYQ